MSAETIDNLIKAIAAYEEAGLIAGVAFRQLVRDLQRSNEPLRISYADISALEDILDRERQQGNDREQKLADVVELTLEKALEEGVFVTQDVVQRQRPAHQSLSARLRETGRTDHHTR